MPTTTSSQTIIAFKSVFARHGIPSELFTDNGPQFSSYGFKKFATEWDFVHTTSSPRYPQSNGQAERWSRTFAISASHEQTIADKASNYIGQVESDSFESSKPQLVARQAKQKHYYDCQSTILPDINRGEIIRMQKDSKHWEPAVIDQKLDDRSYLVRTGDSKVYRRNRRHLLKTGETNLPSAVSDDTEAISDNLSSGDTGEPNATLKTPEAITPRPDPTGRPKRTVRRPKHLEDFICK
uniref:Uncharacterized protein K02A2.6-like n=1 Tax=Crassostrea virginica TaxID=6565 RepID=A0A8B8AV37_CRAVI|nr:uncharacterized protein K02A2.6-like [Crassostrea virginica]